MVSGIVTAFRWRGPGGPPGLVQIRCRMCFETSPVSGSARNMERVWTKQRYVALSLPERFWIPVPFALLEIHVQERMQ